MYRAHANGAITQQTHAVQVQLQSYVDICMYRAPPNSLGKTKQMLLQEHEAAGTSVVDYVLWSIACI